MAERTVIDAITPTCSQIQPIHGQRQLLIVREGIEEDSNRAFHRRAMSRLCNFAIRRLIVVDDQQQDPGRRYLK